ncbi:MAG: hypothetical protein CMK07_16200 [Ponticaulis sp.]|nr:hypothetical protein [Ponticaulis sp.]
MTNTTTHSKPEMKVSLGWVTFPFVYKGQQIIAQASTWSAKTRIWLNDEIVDEIDSWKFSETHDVTLPDGEVVQVTLGYRWGTTLYCEAHAGGEKLFTKGVTQDAKGVLALGVMLGAGIAIGALLFPLGVYIGKAIAAASGAGA